MMSPEQFFDIFLEELKGLPELSHYYKFHTSVQDFEFRKAYFLQRLHYIDRQVKAYQSSHQGPLQIWDCGCGYGTTCLYLAMNGIATFGTTLEFYFDFIQQRKSYWKSYGNSDLFECSYEDMTLEQPANQSIDIVIVQDTLHHLEPIDKALTTFRDVLKPEGILISVEENGQNIIQNLKLFKQRGNKRIISFWDEKLQRTITMGNENIRSMAKWTSLFEQAQLSIDASQTEYIRVLPPFFYKGNTSQEMIAKERSMGNVFLHHFFYFGINFVAKRRA